MEQLSRPDGSPEPGSDRVDPPANADPPEYPPEQIDDLTPGTPSLGSTICMPLDDSDESASSESTGFDSALCEGDSDIGRFRIMGELGRGGMGLVVLAWDNSLYREVALKVLRRPETNPDVLARRFVREARIIAKLDHPGIAPVYELGHDQHRGHYIAMRLVQGESLQNLLRNRPRDGSDLPKLLKIFDQICQTMAYVHSRGVIHRDLKPGNVMLGRFGIVNVMDWGLAKELDSPEDSEPHITEADLSEPTSVFETQYGTVLGTLAYLPPEQARGNPEFVDERADVFTLGGILCEILTGAPPYEARSVRQGFKQALKCRLDRAMNRLNQCGADKRFVELAKRCLQEQPEDRPGSAEEVADGMTALLESDLRQAERDLVRFFELSLDLFCIAGLDGYFRRVNGNFSRLLGVPEHELLSSPFLNFVHEDDREATVAAMSRLDQGLPVVRFANRYEAASGELLTFEWTAQSVPDEGLIYAVARDMTPRN